MIGVSINAVHAVIAAVISAAIGMALFFVRRVMGYSSNRENEEIKR